jgi:hypothetical protein
VCHQNQNTIGTFYCNNVKSILIKIELNNRRGHYNDDCYDKKAKFNGIEKKTEYFWVQ